jgi:hypothetical protein
MIDGHRRRAAYERVVNVPRDVQILVAVDAGEPLVALLRPGAADGLPRRVDIPVAVEARYEEAARHLFEGAQAPCGVELARVDERADELCPQPTRLLGVGGHAFFFMPLMCWSPAGRIAPSPVLGSGFLFASFASSPCRPS